MKKRKGKLIVIDGTDGSGKTTQINLLVKSLKKDGHRVKQIHFPHYENFLGGFIAHCLTEQYYNFINVHPKIVSVLYAADRWESSQEIKDLLSKGNIVILDRYVSANQSGWTKWNIKFSKFPDQTLLYIFLCLFIYQKN